MVAGKARTDGVGADAAIVRKEGVKEMKREGIAVYSMYNGGDIYIGSCRTRIGFLRLANHALRMDAYGLSVHGKGLSGEVSFSGLDRTIELWQRLGIL
jgi:hypothetical protein